MESNGDLQQSWRSLFHFIFIITADNPEKLCYNKIGFNELQCVVDADTSKIADIRKKTVASHQRISQVSTTSEDVIAGSNML